MTHPQQTATVCIFKWCHLTLLSLHSSLTSLVLHPSEWSSWGHPVVLDCYLQLFQQPRCDPEDKWIWKQNCLDRPVQECGFHFFFSPPFLFFSQGKVCSGEEVHREGHREAICCQVPAKAKEGRGLPHGHHERDCRAGVSQGKPVCGGTAWGLRNHLWNHPRFGVVRFFLFFFTCLDNLK